MSKRNDDAVIWQNHIDLVDLMTEFSEGHITPFHLGQAVFSRIKDVPNFLDDHAEDLVLKKIISGFKDISSIEHFNKVLEAFYDWGDEDNRCWIQAY
jgi:hypothetical protein